MKKPVWIASALFYLLLWSGISTASMELLREQGEVSKVRNHQNLWQGYIQRDRTMVFHALIDDGKITWWNEHEPQGVDGSEIRQVADLATTALGLTLGATESNPLGLAIIPLKFWNNRRIESHDWYTCTAEKKTQAGFGSAAATMNIATLLQGAFTPISALFGFIAYREASSRDYRGCELWVGELI